eukprot:TRINITY_DN23895_c0_g1_i1.p1 TRINITY_DN23895_c0_g1~~TRINITY_DN23895_c0_g1_i1.p1  ORF type:complete len:1207 (-),score=282.43 TRINITY_DN23895_c0_g1_i1:76-3612(-)
MELSTEKTLEGVDEQVSDTEINQMEPAHCWKLRKCDERFYLIESGKFPGRFWRTSQGNGVILDSVPELFTGINTNFAIGYELKREENPQKAPEGIKREKYGDILVKYIDRKGIKKDGYICDNEWTYTDAEIFCRSRWHDHTGIPTYDGEYIGNPRNTEYAISGMKCSSADTFAECNFKTECSDNKCKAQRSMWLFDGRGFGCNRGIKSDIAGVICGTQQQIDKIKNQALEDSCNKDQLSDDTRTAAKMASIQQQATEVSQMMTKNRHWSEFLLPLPMTVSLISMLMLISAQYEGVVQIPTGHLNQKWEVLKFDILTPNLYKLNDLIIESFEYSTHAMQKININSVDMNEELEKSIKYSSSKGKLEQRKLKRALRNIEEMSATNAKEATETINRFDAADNYIQELIQAMKLTQSVSEEDKKKLELLKNATERKKLRLEEKSQEKMEQYEMLKDTEKKSRTALYEAAEKAKKASCLMDEHCSSRGTRTCNSCQFKKAYIRKDGEDNPICLEQTERCVEEKQTCKIQAERCSKTEMRCVEYENICPNPKTVCLAYGTPGCQEFKRECKRYQPYSSEKGSLCSGECGDHSCGPTWNTPCCKTDDEGWEDCKKGSEGKCVKHGDKCTKYWEKPCEKWGVTCPGGKKNVCIKEEESCADNTEYCKEFETVCERKEISCKKYDWVSEGTFCMDQNSLQSGACCSGCAGREAIEETLQKVFETSVRLATKSLQDDSNIDIVDMIITQDLEILQSLKRTVDGTAIVDAGEVVKRSTNDETKTEKEKDSISIELDTERLKLAIPSQIDQLNIIAVKNPIAVESKTILGDIKEVIENIPENELKDVLQLNENEKMKIVRVTRQLEDISKRVSKAVEEESVDVSKASFKGSIDIAEKADIYIDSKIQAMKTARKIESLTSSLESALESIASQKIEVNDYKKTIKFLVRCSQYLSKLKVAWGDIKYFFGTLETLLEKVKKSARAIKEEFTDIMDFAGMKRTGPISEDLKKQTVRATAFNIYTKKLSSFYVGIMENGLLRKMRGLDFNRLTPEKAESYKTFILDECKAEMKRISKIVSKEQADLNDELTYKLASIKNKLVCALQENNLPDKFMEFEKFEDQKHKLEQTKEVLSNEDGKGLDDKTLQATGILNDSPVKSLDQYGEASGKKEKHDDEDDGRYVDEDDIDAWLYD